MDIIAVSETRIFDTRTQAPCSTTIRFFHVRQPETRGEVAVLFRKDLDLEVKSIFRDPDRKLVVLDVYNSEDSVFRLVAVFTTTVDKRPDF